MTNNNNIDTSKIITALNKTQAEFKLVEIEFAKEHTDDLFAMIEEILIDAVRGRINTSKIIDFSNNAVKRGNYIRTHRTEEHIDRLTTTIEMEINTELNKKFIMTKRIHETTFDEVFENAVKELLIDVAPELVVSLQIHDAERKVKKLKLLQTKMNNINKGVTK